MFKLFTYILINSRFEINNYIKFYFLNYYGFDVRSTRVQNLSGQTRT